MGGGCEEGAEGPPPLERTVTLPSRSAPRPPRRYRPVPLQPVEPSSREGVPPPPPRDLDLTLPAAEY